MEIISAVLTTTPAIPCPATRFLGYGGLFKISCVLMVSKSTADDHPK